MESPAQIPAPKKDAAWEALEGRLHSQVVQAPERETNQAERAAMRPDSFEDLEWHYYHGGWSG